MTDKDMLWLDSADSVDQETLGIEESGFPFIQWVNGDKKLKAAGGVIYTGGWFMPSDDEEVPEGWTAGSLMHPNGDETDGLFIRNLTCSFIRSRKSWQVQGDDGRSQMFPWDKYDEAKEYGPPRGKYQALVLVQGLEDRGPLMLTLRGTTAMAFSQRRGDCVLSRFQRFVLAPADKANARKGKKTRFPLRAFWLTVGPAINEKNEPVFTEVGKGNATSFVTLPSLISAYDKLPLVGIGQLFVGPEILAEGSRIYSEEGEAWARALDNMPAQDDAPADDDLEEMDTDEPIDF